jgi:hypothetical protein
MTKKLDFRILSNRRCHFPDCPKRLKQNLVDRNPDAEHCYKHHQELKRKSQNQSLQKALRALK